MDRRVKPVLRVMTLRILDNSPINFTAKDQESIAKSIEYTMQQCGFDVKVDGIEIVTPPSWEQPKAIQDATVAAVAVCSSCFQTFYPEKTHVCGPAALKSGDEGPIDFKVGSAQGESPARF